MRSLTLSTMMDLLTILEFYMIRSTFWKIVIQSDFISKQTYSNQQVMGNSKSQVEFAINLDKQFYFSSEEVKGHIYVSTKKRYAALRIVIAIEGTQSCEFSTLEGQNVKGEKKLINTHYVIGQFGHNQYMDGQYDFPFSFRFLEYLPGTFEETKGYKAKVKYTIKAMIIPKDKRANNLQKSIDIMIRQPQRQGERMLQGETYASCQSCFCLDKGVSRIECYFEKNNYLPGDDCIMICQSDNTKCGLPISRIKCQFMKEVILTAQGGQQRTYTEHINTVFFPGVGAYNSYFGDRAQRETLKLIYKDSMRAITPSTHGHYVRCQYYILVEPMFSGCFSKVVDNKFKVYLTILQPALTYEAINKPEDWRPSIAENANFYLNFDPSVSNEQLTSMNQMTY